MSYVEEEIDFTEEAKLVYGENNFNRGQKTNGAGKSAPLEAVVILLTGKTLRENTVVTDFIKRGEEQTYLYFSMYNDILKTKIEIEREFFIKTSKSQKISIKENGELVEIVDPNHANKIILEYLGIDKDDLLNYYLISKDKYKGFFSAGDAAKKTVVSRFSNIDIVDPIFSKIDLDITNINQIIAQKEVSRATEIGKIEAYKQQIEAEEKRNIKKEKDDAVRGYNLDISNAENNIEQHKNSKKKVEEALALIDPALDELQKRLSKGNSMITSLENLVEQNIKALNTANTTLVEIVNKKREADLLINNAVECPSCSFTFSTANTEKDLTQVKAAIPILEKMNSQATLKLEEISTKKRVDEAERAKAKALKTQLEHQQIELQTKKKAFDQNISSIDTNITQLQNYIQGRRELVSQTSKTIKKRDMSSAQEMLNLSNDTIIQYDKEISKLKDDIDEKNELKNQFIKFKTSLVNKTVKVIEFHCNRTLVKMGSSLSVNIEGYRPKKGGKGLVERITTTIHEEGIPAGSFGSYSSGERGRIEVASILALQSLINSASPSGGLNMLFLDEIIESIDTEGITGIIRELDSGFNKCIFIITHATYDGNYDKVMKVVKDETGESKIEYINVRTA